MTFQRTGQQFSKLPALVDEFRRTSLTESFNKRPALNADILITSTAPTLAQMALIFAANRDFEVKGTNMTTALCTHSTGGGITMTTAGASADQAILIPHQDTSATSWATTDWSTSDQPFWATRIKTGASIAGVHVWAGLMLTSPATFDTADDDDKVIFYYNASINGGRWQLIYSVGDTDYTIDLGLDVAASTTYDLELYIDGDRKVNAYLNGAWSKGTTAMTADIDLIPTIGLEDTAGAAKALTVRKLGMAKIDND